LREVEADAGHRIGEFLLQFCGQLFLGEAGGQSSKDRRGTKSSTLEKGAASKPLSARPCWETTVRILIQLASAKSGKNPSS
jgi:hypothetical protein